MNQNVNGLSVLAEFAGSSIDYADGSATFERRDGDFVMSISHQGVLVRRYKVTRTVGSRFYQMFIGLQIEGPEPKSDPVYRDEGKLPFVYWIARKQWFPQTYDELPSEPEYQPDGTLSPFYAFYRKRHGTYRRNCILCHNTYAYATRFAPVAQGAILGFPVADLQLPASSHGNAVDSRELPTLQPHELITLGISCESCHFGGREHAVEGHRIRFAPSGANLSFPKATEQLIAQGAESAYLVNAICAQCHSAKAQGITYPSGSASWNSREATDMASGACAGAIKCTDCHNPHQAGPNQPVKHDAPGHVAACLRCHQQYAEPDAAMLHTGHPAAAEVSCLDCHMPRIVHGLADIIRTHQISSPTHAQMFEGDYPNACNLCHLDRSVEWTLAALDEHWQRRVLPTRDTSSQPGPAGPRWLKHPVPIVRQVAAHAYSRSSLVPGQLELVLPILEDPIPANRMFGLLAVERLLGRELPLSSYTPWASPAERQQQVDALRRGQQP